MRAAMTCSALAIVLCVVAAVLARSYAPLAGVWTNALALFVGYSALAVARRRE